MRKHGTYVRYVQGPDENGTANCGCRCEECRRANAEYVRSLNRRKAYGGSYWGWVDAERAREHVLSLVPRRSSGRTRLGATIDGLSFKRIAKLSGVPHGSLSKLIYGGPGDRPPSRRIRVETERKLLAVTRGMLADGARVDSSRTVRLLQELIAWYNAEVGAPASRKPDSPHRVKGRGGLSWAAREVGMLPSNLNALLGRRYVNVSTRDAAKRLHDGVFNEHASFRWRYCRCPDSEHPRGIAV